MEQTTIEINVRGQVFKVQAGICPKCGAKIHPISELSKHEHIHIVSEPEYKEAMCRECDALFTVKTDGPKPGICPRCRASVTDHSKQRKKVKVVH